MNIVKKLSLVVGVSSIFIFSTSVHAYLLTSNSISSPTIIDFSNQATVSNVSGPIQIGTPVGLDIQVTGDPNTGLYTNYESWSLIDNGRWGNGKTYISANDALPGSLIFQFISGPVSAVGGFMNYATGYPVGDGNLIISAYDVNHTLLEQYNVSSLAPISTYGYNDGAFRGIQRASADISYFDVFGFDPAIDDLTFTGQSTPVPEPGTIILLGVGLAGLVIYGKRRAKA